MNFNFNEELGFEYFLKKTCTSTDDRVLILKNNFGDGQITKLNIDKGLNLYIFDFVLKEPLLIRWDYKEIETREYYLFHNIFEQTNQMHQDVSTVEHGAVIFAQNNERRRLWMPNTRYNILCINFSHDWYKAINKTIPFPKQIQDNLIRTNKLYLHLTPTSTSSLVAAQIKKSLTDSSEVANTYFGIKCLELIYLLFTDALRNINELKVQSSIHPQDLSNLNNFMGQLYNKLENTPDIETAADRLGMSSSKFQRVFKSLMGNTYYNYVFKLKMDAAMEFLLNKNPVSEVAFKLGYSSIGNFTHAFKRSFNILPSDILKQASKNMKSKK